MLIFPNAKINLGLHVTGKRSDGYHSIETIFYPLPGLHDALEFIPDLETSIRLTGIPVDGNPMDNLVIKAYRLLTARFDLPPLRVHLHKAIPPGAGLGGGSADGAFMLKALAEYFSLPLQEDELRVLASGLGSDCAFFIQNTPVLATGRGEVMEPLDINLLPNWILVIKPPFGIATARAYKGIAPKAPALPLNQLMEIPVKEWKRCLVNDFEPVVFGQKPELGRLKEALYEAGALYASLSGSGSALYGIFGNEPVGPEIPAGYFSFKSKAGLKQNRPW